jgi:lipopolysaccharide biosynthesis glycosyltransferase
MVIDLALWRRDRITSRALDYVRAYHDRVCYLDQEGLNAVLSGLWSQLDPRWNHNVGVPDLTGGAPAESDAWIVHFAGNLKPWRLGVRNSPTELYFRYLDMTPWKGWRPRPSPLASLVNLYERSGARRVLYPLEELVMRAVRATTKRTVAAES